MLTETDRNPDRNMVDMSLCVCWENIQAYMMGDEGLGVEVVVRTFYLTGDKKISSTSKKKKKSNEFKGNRF